MEIDRSRPPFRDDPVIACLTDEQVAAFAALIAQLAASYVRRRTSALDEEAPHREQVSDVA